MSTNIKTIKILLVMTLITLLLTYIVHLNIEFLFLTLDTKWISNNLLFTVCCSIFTAMFVALLSEICQYRMSKQGNLHFIFVQFASMYGQLIHMQNTMKKWMVRSDEIVSDSGFLQSVSVCKMHIENLKRVDYSTWCKKDEFAKKFMQFTLNDYTVIMNFLNNVSYLGIAVNTDKLNNLKNGREQGNPTFCSHYTGKVITQLDKNIVFSLLLVNRMLEDVDVECNKKYNWSSLRDRMQISLNNFEETSMEKFVGEDNKTN